MKKKTTKKLFSLVLCLMLAMSMAVSGCGSKEDGSSKPESETNETVENKDTENTDDNVLGEGEVKFMLDVTDKDGVVTNFEIHTDKKTVGEALVEVGLVEGTESEYGLMIDTVDGKKLDFNKDGMYWAFLIDGEYAQTGVDSTDVVDGTTYAFEASK